MINFNHNLPGKRTHGILNASYNKGKLGVTRALYELIAYLPAQRLRLLTGLQKFVYVMLTCTTAQCGGGSVKDRIL